MKLKRGSRRPIDEIISEIRAKVNKQYPQLDVDFIQQLQDQIGDLTSSPQPIQIKLFSPDPNLLKQWSPKIATRIKKIKGVVDVKDGIENTISGPAIVMKVDPVVAARSGFTPQEIELDASAMLQGEPATTPIVVNDRAYTLRVRFPENTRATLDQIRNTMITSSSTGKTATLGSLAEFQDEAGQTEILRENLLRYVAVTGRFEGISLGKGIEIVQQAVADMNLPPSIRVVYGGTYAEQQKSFRDLLVVLALAVVLVFTVLLFEFRTFAAPAAILASALLSTSGVFFALLITGTTFNISSFMGLIMVIGIVAKNGILLLDADQRFRAEGIIGARRHDRGRGAPAAADPDDGAGDDCGHDSALARHRRRLADAAAAGHCRHRRPGGVDGAVADRHPGGALLFERRRSNVSNLTQNN